MQLQPLFTLIISIVIIGLIINASSMNGKIQKRRLLAAFINSFIWLVYCVMFNVFEFMDNGILNIIVFIYSILVYIVFGFVLYFTIRTMTLKNNHYNLFIDSMKNTKRNIYLVVDHKERTKEISSAFLDELGLKYDDVIGENIFNIFDKTVRFTKYNEMDINNKSIREYYKNYKNEAKRGSESKLEIVLQNCKGETIVLNVVEKPVYMFNSYKGRMIVGEKNSTTGMFSVERELNNKNNELESIRLKFVTTLEILEECLFYYDLDEKYLWGNDVFKEKLGFSDNTLSIDEYLECMHPEDLNNYKHIISNISINNPKYSVSYRFKVKGEYIWVKEVAKRIYDDVTSNCVMGYIKIQTVSKQKNVKNDDNPLIDLLKTENELISDLNKLFDGRRIFELAIISVRNIKDIFLKHGNEFGNMMLVEYVKKLKRNFLSENAELYRINENDFALTITDVRKIELLKRALNSDPNVMNLKVEYGAIKEMIEVNMGISRAMDDAGDSNTLLNCAKKALSASQSSKYPNCLYYRDIK